MVNRWQLPCIDCRNDDTRLLRNFDDSKQAAERGCGWAGGAGGKPLRRPPCVAQRTQRVSGGLQRRVRARPRLRRSVPAVSGLRTMMSSCTSSARAITHACMVAT
jgi:hypothetical protein